MTTTSLERVQRWQHLAAWLVAMLLLLAALATFAYSSNHPINADLAMLHYSAWLINERDFVVYRDIFELNFPGPFLFHSLLGQWLGYEAVPLRVVDFCLLLLLGSASWMLLAPVSRPAAMAGTALFVLLYLANGGEFVLERDYLALLPAAIAFAIACHTGLSKHWHIALTAVFAAMACSMKPNSVVIVPVFIVLLWQHASWANTVYRLGLFIGCMTIVAAIPFAWIAYRGGLDAFIDIYRSFVPIYANSRYDLWHYSSGRERLAALLELYSRYGGGALLLSAPGLLWAWWQKKGDDLARQRIVLIGSISAAFTFYEAIAGKFWFNHMFPSAYWCFLCLAMLLTRPRPTAAHWQGWLALVLLLPLCWLGALLAQYSLPTMYNAHQQEARHPDDWRARRVANFLLKEGLDIDDRVQVLDMAGDGQATLLLAKATSATRHLIDVPFYMQPDSTSTRALRAELLHALRDQPPRFVIFFDEFLHPGGGNRLREFRELYTWLESEYTVAQQEEGEYTIFRRK